MPAGKQPPAATVYADHAREVYRWAYRLLGRHHDALDVVQEVFVRWAAQCAAAPPDHPRGWLRRVAINRAIDMIKARRNVCASEINDVIPTPEGRHDAERMDHGLLRADVADALQDLTDAQRGVLVARVYDGLTFEQIAAELGVSVSTVKTHYVRALQAVGRSLKGRWEHHHEP